MKTRNLLTVRSLPSLVLILMAVLAGAGCSPASESLRADAQDIQIPQSSDEPRTLGNHRVPLDEIESIAIEPGWTRQFVGHVHVDMSPGGRVAMSSHQRRTGTVEVYNSQGEVEWSEAYLGYDETLAWFAGDQGQVAAWVHRRSAEGLFILYDRDGQELFRRQVQGSIAASVSGDGSRTALVQHGEELLEILDESGRVLSRLGVAVGASVTPIPDWSGFVVASDRALRLLDGQGRVMREDLLPRDLVRDVAASPGGSRLAVTTGGGDNSVTVLDGRGDQIWSHLLMPGGSNDLVYDADGDRLLVYNVGLRGGLYLFDTRQGTLRWRQSLNVDPDETTATWRHVEFCSQGRRLVGILSLQDLTKESGLEEYQLVIISTEGEFLLTAPLGTSLDVSLNADGSLLAVGGTVGGTGTIREAVRFYNLERLVNPAGESSYR